jgi:hypothetical protein
MSPAAIGLIAVRFFGDDSFSNRSPIAFRTKSDIIKNGIYVFNNTQNFDDAQFGIMNDEFGGLKIFIGGIKNKPKWE